MSETTCRLKKIYGTSTKCRFTTAILSCKYETVQNLENHWTTKYEPDSSFLMMPGGVVTHNRLGKHGLYTENIYKFDSSKVV